VEITERITVHDLGIFHAVRLEVETNSHRMNEVKNSRDLAAWHDAAHRLARDEFRAARYKNIMLKTIGAVLIVVGVFIGICQDGVIGIAYGAAFAVTGVLIAEYSSGQKKGF